MLSVKKLFSCLTLFVVFTVVPVTPSWAALTCAEIFYGTSEKREILSQKLSELPGLRSLILEMIDDPSIPGNIKRILEISLVRENTVVKQLTMALHRELNLPENFNAAHASRDLSFRRMNPENSGDGSVTADHSMVDPLHSYKQQVSRFLSGDTSSGERGNHKVSANQEATDQVNTSLITAKQMVFVQDRPISREVNDFITLVHELSHVRFDYFLEKNLENLLRKLPSELIRSTNDGVVEINGELYDFLSERYAFQTEFELLSATVGRYYPDRYSRYGFDVTLQNYKPLISGFIMQSYRITDPLIVRLRDFSISDILLGRPF